MDTLQLEVGWFGIPLKPTIMQSLLYMWVVRREQGWHNCTLQISLIFPFGSRILLIGFFLYFLITPQNFLIGFVFTGSNFSPKEETNQDSAKNTEWKQIRLLRKKNSAVLLLTRTRSYKWVDATESNVRKKGAKTWKKRSFEAWHVPYRNFHNFRAATLVDRQTKCSLEISIDGVRGSETVKRQVG